MLRRQVLYIEDLRRREGWVPKWTPNGLLNDGPALHRCPVSTHLPLSQYAHCPSAR
jgi:hypothetical protein